MLNKLLGYYLALAFSCWLFLFLAAPAALAEEEPDVALSRLLRMWKVMKWNISQA